MTHTALAPAARPAARLAAVLIGVLIGVLAVAGCADDQPLSGPELQALFADRTVEGEHELYGYTFRSYYASDGTFRSFQDASGQAQTARWWVRGNDLCIRWDSQTTDLCRKIVKRWGKYRKVIDGSGKTVVTFDRFREGNPDRL